MDKNLKIAIILSAVDKMSAIISRSVNASQAKLQSLSQKSIAFGTASAGASAGIAAMLSKPVTAFADLEDASLNLKSTMMQDGGILPIKQFEALNKLAVGLGNKLPGTTSDFTKMFAAMKSNGADVQTVIDGLGKAASYYAIATKQEYEAAGIATTRLQQQMGIANKDMLSAVDIMSRIRNTGIDPTEMEYFFAKSSAAMKMFNIQGLESFKTAGVLGSMLVKQFKSGETAGTGLTKIMNELANPKKLTAFNAATEKIGVHMRFFDGKGKFIGLENMYAQFSKLSKLNPTQLNKVLFPLTGGDGADNSMIGFMANANIAGFNKQAEAMAKQATLVDKIDILLNSLSAKWEAGLGNLTNALAAFGGTLAPILKALADSLGVLSAKMQTWIEKYPVLTRNIGIVAVALSGLMATMSALSFLNAGAIASWSKLSMIGTGLSVILLRIGQAGLLFGATVRYWGLLLLTRGIPALATMAATVAQSSLVLFTRGIPAMASFTAAVWANTAAWLANPVTWIVLAIIAVIAALAAAAYLIYKNWDPICKWFSEQWTIIKAQVSGAIAVFNLLNSVIVGIGKSMVGLWTADPSMIVAGAKQAASAFSSIMGGGISKAYNAAYDRSMAMQSAQAGAARFNATAPKPGANPVGNRFNPFPTPLQPVKKSSGTQVNHFSPVINLSGSATKQDGQTLADALKPHWEKWQREKALNAKMTAY